MIVTASCSSSALQLQDHCSISKNGSLCFKVRILTFPACLGNQYQSTILNFTYVCLHPHTHTAHTLTHILLTPSHTLLTPSHTHCSHPHTHTAHTLTHSLLTPSHTHCSHHHTHHSHPHRHCSHATLHTHCSHHHPLTPMLSLLSCSCLKILQAAIKAAGLPGGEDQGVSEVLAHGQAE